MNSTQNTLQGKWVELKGEIQKQWGKLTNDELEQTKGDIGSIRGLIQQRYGKAQEDYGTKFDSLIERFHDKKEEVVESVKDSLRTPPQT